MTNPPQETVDQLVASLEKLERSTGKLDEVLAALFEVLSERGLKPTPHLTNVQEALKAQVAEARAASTHVTGQLAQMRELVRTSALITSSLDLDEVLDDVMDTVIHLTNAERAYLMLYDDKGNLKVRAARNWEKESLDEANVGFSRTVINMALQDGKAVLTTNAQADERFEARASVVLQQLRSIICIPLALAGKTVGVLYADSRLKKDLFQQENVPILTAFGTQAAIAISNAQLFGQVKLNLVEAERVIESLRIEVDRSKVDSQVREITDSEYFQYLAATAHLLRERFHLIGQGRMPSKPVSPPTSPGPPADP